MVLGNEGEQAIPRLQQNVAAVDHQFVGYGERRTYTFAFSAAKNSNQAALEVVVRYHLLEEKRRKQIGYENKEPISYEVFRKRISVR